MRLTLHVTIWPMLFSVVLLAVEGKLLDTWYYDDFVGPWHTLWFLGLWLLGVAPYLLLIACAYFVKRALRWVTRSF